MPREPREQFVVDLLTDQWNNANTHGLTPSIVYASQDEPSSPHVTVEIPDGGPIGGGETGYDGIDPGGGSPHQTISETVTCHGFAQDGNLSGASTDAAAVYLFGSGSTGGVLQEIKRIVEANAVSPSNPSTGNEPVELIAFGGSNPGPTDEDDREHLVVTLFLLHWTG